LTFSKSTYLIDFEKACRSIGRAIWHSN